MARKSLDSIISNYDPSRPAKSVRLTKEGGSAPVSVWLEPGYKAKYDRLQELDPGFCKLLRELMQAAIDNAHAQAS